MLSQFPCCASCSPSGWNRFSHRLTAYKIVGHFFGLPYLNKSGNNQVDNIFFQFHARMLSSEVAQSLKSYGHFSDFGGWDRSQGVTTMLNFSGKANTSIHGLWEDNTAILVVAVVTQRKKAVSAHLLTVSRYCLLDLQSCGGVRVLRAFYIPCRHSYV